MSNPDPGLSNGSAALFPGDSEMAGRMRNFAWHATALGPPASWPRTLQTCVRLLLTARQPMFLCWGPELVHLYNDAYATFLRAKHPAALGQSAPSVWPEIWRQLAPRVELAREHDVGTYDDALRFVVERRGYPEEVYLTFSCSPVPDDAGRFGGILCPLTDETRRIMDERQLALLRELTTRAAEARTPDAAAAAIATALETDPDDVAFALLYLIDAKVRTARLAAAVAVEPGSVAAPRIAGVDGEPPWRLADGLDGGCPLMIGDLAAISKALPRVRGQYPVETAMVMPVGGSGASAVLVVGLNPLRILDMSYKRFLDMAAGAVAAALMNAQAHEAQRERLAALAEIGRLSAQRQQLLRKLVAAHEQEQGRLARELHDGVGQNLTACRLVLPQLLDSPEASRRASVQKLDELTTEMAKDLHRIAVNLRPTALDDLGLGRMLKSYLAEWASMTGIPVSSHFDGIEERLPLEIETTVYRIIQEALANVVRHSWAKQVSVIVERPRGMLLAIVEDDGVGFATDAPAVPGAHAGTGLLAMRERAALLDGVLEIESAPQQGTSVYLRIPLASA